MNFDKEYLLDSWFKDTDCKDLQELKKLQFSKQLLNDGDLEQAVDVI